MKAFLLPLSIALFSTGALADTYNIDLAHSSAHWTAKHFGVGLTKGRFNDMAGTFTLDAKNPAANKVEITVKTDSVDSNQTKRDQHLKSPDFFDAKQFPTLSFVSERVVVKPDGNLDVTGKLTLHGVTKQVTFTAVKIGEGKDPFGGYRAGYTASFVVKRSEYGMKFMLDGVSDDITLDIALEGVKQ
jgi:polyisoprenoid-binding protein YceI